ncbi:uncharacterized protein TNCV_3883911 [Trichonephila clavipes]|nr:uncharacterized protein TNCV_3883911 [Trichonephila clavipes]
MRTISNQSILQCYNQFKKTGCLLKPKPIKRLGRSNVEELLWHGGTLNSRRAASPPVWLVEEEESLEASGHPQGFLPLNWGGTTQNRTVTCMVLKARTNDTRKNSSP